MNFHGTKKLLLKVSHNLWAQNQKIVFERGIWNPRACMHVPLCDFYIIILGRFDKSEGYFQRARGTAC